MRALRLAAYVGALSVAFASRTGAAQSVTRAGAAEAVPAPAAPAAPMTPVAAGEPWSAEQVVKLGADLDALLTGAPALRGAHAGVLALDTRTGSLLYARNADDSMQAASSTKLIVGSAALEKLGPAFRFHTSALLDAAGTLVLRGGGDPFLNAADMAALAAAVAAAGVRALPSGVAVDDTAFDRSSYPDGWTLDDIPYDYSAPVSALNFEENTVHLGVTPGAAPGSPVHVDIAHRGTLRGASATCAPTSEVVVIAAARTLARRTESTLDLQRDRGGCIRVAGALAADASLETLDAAVPSPPLFARRALVDALRTKGITVADFPNGVDATDERRYVPRAGTALHEVWAHDSAPLAEFLGPRFWVPSDNLVAELLLKSIGAHASGAPGTTAKGTASELTWLGALGIDVTTLSLFDGSGLSRYDRVTPRALVQLLQHDWAGPYRQSVLDSLPLGGVRGSIPGIPASSPLAGRVYAKTGSFMHVRGLAGYLATQRHGAVTFAFIVDDWIGADATIAALRAAVLERIAAD